MGVVFAGINNLAYFLQPQLVIPFSATAKATIFISSSVQWISLCRDKQSSLFHTASACYTFFCNCKSNNLYFFISTIYSLCKDKQSSLFLTASASYTFFRNCKSNNLYLFICTMGFVFAGTNTLACFLEPQLVKPLSATVRETFNNFVIFHVISQTGALDNMLEYLSMVTSLEFSSGITKNTKYIFIFFCP
jgi:hypothetical protein